MRIRQARSGIRLIPKRARPSPPPALQNGENTFGVHPPVHYRPPTSLSPLHPSSAHHTYGLVKFTTGALRPSDALKRLLRAQAVAVKIYSQGPLSKATYRHAFDMFTEKDTAPATSLQSSILELYYSNVKFMQLSDGIRDVFVQAFVNPKSLRALRLPQFSILRSNRGWILHCRLYRPDSSSAANRPQLCLNIPRIRLSDWCTKLQEAQDSGEWTLGLQIDSYLKPQQLAMEYQVPETETVGRVKQETIQGVVDDFVKAAAGSVFGREFTHPIASASVIKQAVLSLLPLSRLGAIVDFHGLEVQMLGAGRRRFVLNVLLNADGTEKSGSQPLDEYSPYGPGEENQDSYAMPKMREDLENKSSSPILPDSSQQQDTADDPSLGDIGSQSFALSTTTQRKIGVMDLKLKVREEKDQSMAIRTRWKMLLEFDQLCHDIGEEGLACCAKAARLLADRFRPLGGGLTSKPFYLKSIPSSSSSEPSKNEFQYQLGLYTNGAKGTGIVVMLPPLFQVKVSVKGFSDSTVDIPGIYLIGKYVGDPYADSGTQKGLSLSAPEELRILTRMVSAVIERLCKEVEFESIQMLVDEVAKAIKSAVQFPSRKIALHNVKLRVVHSEYMSSVVFGKASRASSGGLHTDEPQPASSQHCVDCISLPMFPDNQEIEGIETEGQTGSLPRSGHLTILEGRDLPKRESTHLAERKEPEARPKDRKTLKSRPIIFSEALLKKTGFTRYYFTFDSELQDSVLAPDLDTAQVQAVFDEALAASPRSGLICVKDAIAKCLESIPGKVDMKVIATDDGFKTATGIRSLIIPNNLDVIFHGHKQVHPAGQTGSVKFSFPPMTGFKFQLDKQSQFVNTTTLMIVIKPYGNLSDSNKAGSANTTTQFSSVLQDAYRTVDAVLKASIFSSLEALTEGITLALTDNSHEFEPIMKLFSLKVVAIMDGKNGQSTRAQASWAAPSKPFVEQLSQTELSEVNNSQVEIPRSESTELDTETNTPQRKFSGLESLGMEPAELKPPYNRVFVALGSNVGDRIKNIEAACREMDLEPDLRVARTGNLYETDPMYVTDQERFLNGACEIETTLRPMQLLDRLQSIEERLGRVKTVEKGPRNIDLDILLYRRERVNTDRLTIPHPLMFEREFVLRPLSDINTAQYCRFDTDHLPIAKSLKQLPPCSQPMHSFTPLGVDLDALRASDPKRSTRVMSILNITPDSFSDGGTYKPTDIADLQSAIREQIIAGASIVDIGGQSSRPNAPDVTSEEELARIIPAIEAVKSLPEAHRVAISVDTYRANVAEAAVKAGAHIINDISAGTLDPDMLSTVARLGCTYIMMHMRGTPSTMQNEENCAYPHGLIETIHGELFKRVLAAQGAGIRGWRIILDPGIGFSKTQEQNLLLLRDFRQLKSKFPPYPWLIGSSRKSFIGKITGVEEPKERGWGTAATVTAAVQGGADIVRVHDVEEMSAVVKMADAVYRG